VQYLISTPSQLSHALHSCRKTRGFSQLDAGRLAGLLPKTISAMENHPGSVSIDSLLKLLSALGWSSCLCLKRPAVQANNQHPIPKRSGDHGQAFTVSFPRCLPALTIYFRIQARSARGSGVGTQHCPFLL